MSLGKDDEAVLAESTVLDRTRDQIRQVDPTSGELLKNRDQTAGLIGTLKHDESGNQTRFVVVSRDGVPAPSGHDRTGLVVFQRADEPGSLISILQEFAARRINLSNLISRPIKHGGLGEYCFIILAEGHVGDDLMADTMRSLHAKQASVKWFGSWPRADAEAHEVRAHADERWRQADDWIDQIRQRIN